MLYRMTTAGVKGLTNLPLTALSRRRYRVCN